MRRLLTGPIPALAVLLAVSATLPADAQSDIARNFRATSTAVGTQFACGLSARDANNTDTAAGFSIRPPRHALTVSVVQGITVTAATVDTALDNASALMQGAQQPPGDVACCVELRRTGAVGTFAPAATMVGGVVSTQAEQNFVLNINADLKYVSAIAFCGLPNGPYAGCAGNGTLMVVSGTGAATYAHEIGHREGLCHVGTNCAPTCGQAGNCAGCGDPSANDIMYFRLCGGNQNILRSGECTTMRQAATP